MAIAELDTVALVEDLPKHDLRKGDFGAVVSIYSPDAFEVEFVTAAGRTQALVTLSSEQIRPVDSQDILAVRRLDAA